MLVKPLAASALILLKSSTLGFSYIDNLEFGSELNVNPWEGRWVTVMNKWQRKETNPQKEILEFVETLDNNLQA